MASELEPDLESDLDWLAFRYVAGELSPAQVEAFENRLDRDQSAREAVALAVALAQAVAAIEPATHPILPMPRRGRVGPTAGALALGLAAAACLAWMIVGADRLASRGALAQPGPGDRSGTIKPSASVTLAWSTLRLESAGDEDEVNPLRTWSEEMPEVSDPEFPMPGEAEESSGHSLPPWLLEAASLAGRTVPGTIVVPVKEH